ncbi:transcriptional regulator [Mycolicibacterium sp. P1-18]|uniref:winged helix-turn-helix transcriptional regulator n=1 Tax=Mycolicibacterium sp. P1-18 TaxID=2024615 RepID=UPI0011F188DC|nr:helix-turn-helix domain-containing protein [Mycolicibacterium sp. P1-18]KAA0097968.1 transcriptional regulator [Mycolicibacterium sp. P1-18]
MPGSIDDLQCSIERSLHVVGERWSLLVLREAHRGATRFDEFRDALGVSSDILTARLSTLVTHGVLERRPYREPGRRERLEYHLTESGRQLQLVLGALGQWGDTYLPRPQGPSIERRSPTGQAVRLCYVDESGAEVSPVDVKSHRTAAYS